MAKPVKITKATLAAGAAERWLDRYGSWDDHDPGKLLIYRWLVALGSAPTPEQVAEVVGNTSWTAVPTCDGCGDENAPAVVRVGDVDDYDSATAYLCAGCLTEALRLIQPEDDGNGDG